MSYRLDNLFWELVIELLILIFGTFHIDMTLSEQKFCNARRYLLEQYVIIAAWQHCCALKLFNIKLGALAHTKSVTDLLL